MLIRFDDPRAFTSRILGIDNGSTHLGVSINDHDIRTGVSTIIYQRNFDASKSVEARFPGRIRYRNEFRARLDVIDRFIGELLEEYDPDMVGCESPFSHLNARTYASLITSMNVIDDAVYRYRPNLPFVKVPPGSGKKAGCQGYGYKDDKEWVRFCLLKNPSVVWKIDIEPELMGPDAMDSVAVGRYLALLETLE